MKAKTQIITRKSNNPQQPNKSSEVTFVLVDSPEVNNLNTTEGKGIIFSNVDLETGEKADESKITFFKDGEAFIFENFDSLFKLIKENENKEI